MKEKKNQDFHQTKKKKKNISGDLKKFPIPSTSDTMLNSNMDMFRVEKGTFATLNVPRW